MTKKRKMVSFNKHRFKVLLIKVLIKKWECWSKVLEKFSNHSLFSPLKDDQDSGFWSAPLHLDAFVGEPPQQRPQPWFCDHFIYFSKTEKRQITFSLVLLSGAIFSPLQLFTAQIFEQRNIQIPKCMWQQDMTQCRILGKFEYTRGPIFKVVLEC